MESNALLNMMLKFNDWFSDGSRPFDFLDISQFKAARTIDKVLQTALAKLELGRKFH
jgi:hypothetical protein